MAKPTIDQPNWGTTLNDHLDSLASDIDARETPAGAQAKADAAKAAAVSQVADDVDNPATPVGAAAAAAFAPIAEPRFYAGDKTLYVSPTSGSDTNHGRAAGAPLQTIGAALSALSSGGRAFLLPGSHQLSGAISLATRTDITLDGAGPNLSQIVVNGNYNALTLSGVNSRVTIQNLWIGSFAARTAGQGISIVGTSGTHSDNIRVENVVIQNTAQGMLLQYADLVQLHNVKYVQSIAGATIAGSLFRVISSASVDIDRLVVQRTTAANIASDALVLDSDTDTILVTKAELLNANRGFVLLNSLGGASTGPRLIRLTDSYAESMTSSGFVVSDGRDVRIRGGHSAVNAGSGYDISGGSSIKMADCVALQNNLHGYYIHGAGLTDTRLIGSDASNNSQASNAAYDGCRIEDNTTHVRVIGGRFGDYVFTAFPNKQRYGLSVGSTATNYIVAQGNDFAGNATGGLGNFSGGANNSVTGNVS